MNAVNWSEKLRKSIISFCWKVFPMKDCSPEAADEGLLGKGHLYSKEGQYFVYTSSLEMIL